MSTTFPRTSRTCFSSLVSTVIAAFILTLPVARPACAQVQVIDSGVSFWQANNTDPGEMSWLKVIQLFNQNLGDAKQFNLYTDLCYDGRVVDLQNDPKTALTMPYQIGTSASAIEKSTDASSGSDKTPPGRLAKHDTKDQVVADSYYMSYLAYLTKGLRNPALPTVKALHDNAVADRNQEPILTGTPQYKLGNGGVGTLKVTSGTKQNDMVFAGDLSNNNVDIGDQPYLALKALSPASLQYYSHNFTSGADQVKIDGQGTVANFKSALATMKTAMAADKGNQLVNIFMKGHGSKVTKNVQPKPAPIPATPMQGEQVIPQPLGPEIFNISMDSDLWNDLKQGVTVNDPTLERGKSPEFFLSVSEANTPLPFTISIAGLSLGQFTFPTTTSAGAMLEVPISDSYLSTLIANNDGASQLPITFDLPAGDSFRLALDDDMLFNPAFEPTDVGTGIAEYVDSISYEPVPEPASLALCLLATTAVMRRRR